MLNILIGLGIILAGIIVICVIAYLVGFIMLRIFPDDWIMYSIFDEDEFFSRLMMGFLTLIILAFALIIIIALYDIGSLILNSN